MCTLRAGAADSASHANALAAIRAQTRATPLHAMSLEHADSCIIVSQSKAQLTRRTTSSTHVLNRALSRVCRRNAVARAASHPNAFAVTHAQARATRALARSVSRASVVTIRAE